MIKNIFLLLIMVIIWGCSNTNTINQNSKQNIVYQNWFFVKDDKKQECYIFSFPLSSSGKYLERDYNYLMVNMKDIILFGGLEYRKNELIVIKLDKTNIFVTPESKKAFLSDREKIIELFLSSEKAEFLVINKFQDNSEDVIDKYSLLGFKKAYNNMKKKCQS